MLSLSLTQAGFKTCFFKGLFLALASTFSEPLRKSFAWRVRLRRGKSVCGNNCLKAIINLIISFFIADIGIGHRIWTSRTSILVVCWPRKLILSPNKFSPLTCLRSGHWLRWRWRPWHIYCPEGRCQHVQNFSWNVYWLCGGWSLFLLHPSPRTWKIGYRPLSRSRDKFHVYAIFHSLCSCKRYFLIKLWAIPYWTWRNAIYANA